MRWMLCWLLALMIPPTALHAQTPVETRAQQLVALFAGSLSYDAYFADSFKTAVPKAQFDEITKSLVAAAGPPLRIEKVAPLNTNAATVTVGFERAVASVLLVVETGAPHRVTGLRITGTEPRGDNLAKLAADFNALPARKGLLIRPLGGGAPLLAINAEAPLAIGSAFKLWVLAEAARSVAARERSWSSVVPLGPPTLASGITQTWPAAAPVTLHTLATLMISISDNTATDTLMGVLDRRRIDALAASTGAAKTLPVLSTSEMFALKTQRNTDLADRWVAAGVAERRSLVAQARERAAAIDPTLFSGAPNRIDSIEWFAAPSHTSQLLDQLRLRGEQNVLAILGVNSGLAPPVAGRFSYVGFKGGSEPGVISMNFLLRTKAGTWFSVTGSWNDAARDVDAKHFAALMDRALLLVAQR